MSDEYKFTKYGKTKNKELSQGFTITVSTLDIEVLNFFDEFLNDFIKEMGEKDISKKDQ